VSDLATTASGAVIGGCGPDVSHLPVFGVIADAKADAFRLLFYAGRLRQPRATTLSAPTATKRVCAARQAHGCAPAARGKSNASLATSRAYTCTLYRQSRPAHHTGSVSWATSSDAMNGGRGAQAHAQHHSQSLSQGTAAGGAAQGALASSVQAASTLAVGTEQAPAFSTRFATQRRHIACPPSLTSAIATAAQVLTGGTARAR
jgi:hypothetical protein